MAGSKRIWGTLDPYLEMGPVLGRRVANATFLNALLRADPFDEYHFFPGDKQHLESLQALLATLAPGKYAEGRLVIRHRRELPQLLKATDYTCFHQSDCITYQPHLSRLRNRVSKRIFPITGVIHSLSYQDYAGAFLRHLWTGTSARDAIVCTSTAGQGAVENFFEVLREHYCLDPMAVPSPVLARIPLGIDLEWFAPEPDRGGNKVRILLFGRISHYSKMDILPVMRALHRLVQDGLDPTSVELVLAGWTDDNDDYTPIIEDLAYNLDITLKVHPRPTDAEKMDLYATADIFVSVADNPQETFGITLLEAGAARLPAVVSDYDGYRDIVKDGETGLLVPTLGAAHTGDVDTLAPLFFDNQYHLLLSQRTVVDVPKLAEALRTLIEDPGKRAAMGEAARARVEECFQWSTVVEQYVALWDRLNETPVDRERLREARHPLQVPYGRIFAHYHTATLASETLLKAGRTGEAYYRGKDFPLLYAGLEATIDPEPVKKLVFFARKPIDTLGLLAKFSEAFPQMTRVEAENHILWALKHDILEQA